MSASVVWFEVTGQDAAALKGFYGGMFGWSMSFDNPQRYAQLPKEEGAIGGGVGLRDGAGWSTFYVAVPDIEAQVAQAQALGGQVLDPIRPMPGGSFIAVVADPDGNAVGLYQGAPASA
ncbi:MAG: putative enzyme related to lactoylglutathione lyase [Myxococcota bacterium]